MLTFLSFLVVSPIVAFVASLIPFQIIKFFSKPKAKRDWDTLCSQLPEIIFDKKEEHIVYIRNIRDAKYNPNFEFENKVEYLNKKYNIDNLEKLWIYVNPFATLQNHVVLSFQFGENILDASFLTLSYEVRKTDSLGFNTLKVLYKMFEGYYLIGTEEDVLYVRTNVRKNDGSSYLYELNIDKAGLKKIFFTYSKKVNLYSKKAFKYNFMYRNCLTEIFQTLASEKVIKYNFFDYFSVNKMIYKNKIVVGQDNLSYKKFLQKHKIKHTSSLLPDKNYSFKLRFINFYK